MMPGSPLSTIAPLLCLALLVFTARAETRYHERPPASAPLSYEEARGVARRLHGEGRSLAESVGEDVVEQVHLGLGGPGEVVVTFATWKRGLLSQVMYGPTFDGEMSSIANGTVTTYVTRSCPNNHDLRWPIMSTNGGVPDLTTETLAEIVNVSRLGYPETSASYVHLVNADDAWKKLASRDHCIDYKNPLAYYESPFLHTVVLTGLTSRTRYSYRPTGGNRTFSFTMPVAPGEDGGASAPLKLGVWSDVGTTGISAASMEQLFDAEPDINLLVGDYSYADGWSPKWETFGIMMEPLMSKVPGLGVAGNHEISTGNYQGLDWFERYPQPYRQSGSSSPRQWSYESGPVHILGLPGMYAPTDNETSGFPSSQYLFALQDLQSVNRTRTPWVVVAFHTPWYSSNRRHYQEALKAKWDMEELLYRFGVDVVFNGHVHAYERSFPVYQGQRDPCGAVHIVIGDAGNYEGPCEEWHEPQPAWSAFRSSAFGAGVLTVHNASNAQWEWRMSASATRLPTDSFWSRSPDGTSDPDGAVDAVVLTRNISCSNRGSAGGHGRRLNRSGAETWV